MFSFILLRHFILAQKTHKQSQKKFYRIHTQIELKFFVNTNRSEKIFARNVSEGALAEHLEPVAELSRQIVQKTLRNQLFKAEDCSAL